MELFGRAARLARLQANRAARVKMVRFDGVVWVGIAPSAATATPLQGTTRTAVSHRIGQWLERPPRMRAAVAKMAADLVAFSSMANMPKPPEPALESQSGASLLSAISREMVKAMKTYYGRGPTKAKSYLMDDLLFIVMREGITQAEQTLLSAGKDDEVRAFRRQFDKIMSERLVGTIEQLTERKVVAHQSQVLFEPAMVVQVFVFDQPLERPAIEETARALFAPDVGAASVDDLMAGPE